VIKRKQDKTKQAALTPLQKNIECYSKQGSILPENVLSVRSFERL